MFSYLPINLIDHGQITQQLEKQLEKQDFSFLSIKPCLDETLLRIEPEFAPD